MVDRTWCRVAAWFENYKKACAEAAQAGDTERMQSIRDCLGAFVRGLTYGLNRHYVKKIWNSAGMNEDFDWDLYTEPYLSITKEATVDEAGE